MNDLLQFAIDAHGGFERWQRFGHVSAQLHNGGVLWPLKRQQGVLDDVHVRVALRTQWASHSPFLQPGQRTSFRPERIAIEASDGRTIEERLSPRESFAGHGLETPWDALQLAYFAGYAMWTYLTTPFLCAMDGVATEEIDSWREDGETWRRLKATFPAHIATHGPIQTFYFDAKGLLRRHDYDTEVLGGTPAAHYVYAHQDCSGILVPTRRRVFPRQPDGTAAREPLIVSIELSDVEFT